MRSTFFPLELRFHTFFQFLLISTKCHNPLENHGRNEHHIFFIFAFPNLFFGMAMENVVFTLCFTVFYVFLWNGLINWTSIFIAEELDVCPCWNRKILHLPWMTKDVWNMLTIWSAVSFILVVLFRSRTCDNALENHGRNEERTFFIFMSTEAVWSSWQEREHHLPTKQHLPGFNIIQRTWHDVITPPPTPPICIQERPFWYSIKTEGSSKLRGTPSLEPMYI